MPYRILRNQLSRITALTLLPLLLAGSVPALLFYGTSVSANALLCSPSMLTGRLSQGATTPQQAAAMCGCTGALLSTLRTLGMPMPGQCQRTSTVPNRQVPVQRPAAPIRLEPVTVAAPDTIEPSNRNGTGKKIFNRTDRSEQQQQTPDPVVTAPTPERASCCQFDLYRDGILQRSWEMCGEMCFSGRNPEIIIK